MSPSSPVANPSAGDRPGACASTLPAPASAHYHQVVDGSLYVALVALSEATRLPSLDLLHRFPSNWGVPHDWRMNGAQVLIRASGLKELAIQFDDADEVGRGNAVREFAEKINGPARNWVRDQEAAA